MHPDRILQNEFYDSCKLYADAIVSNDSTQLVNAWRILNQHKLRYSTPFLLEKEFLEGLKSKNWRELAKIEIIRFGYGNCVNHQVYHNHDTTMWTDKYMEEFDAVKTECQQP
jgi:hypothetical protein